MTKRSSKRRRSDSLPLLQKAPSGIRGLDEIKLINHPDLGRILPELVIDTLGEISTSIVPELAGAAIERARALNPL